MDHKLIENWITCEVNPTWKSEDSKKQVQWVITDHKWHTRIMLK